MKIVAIGRSQLMYDTIKYFNAKGIKFACIITGPANHEYTRKEPDFKKLAKDNNCPFFSAEYINEDIRKTLAVIKPDIALSVNWKTVIKWEIIRMFRYGIMNYHFGDLPAFRGNATPNWAIIAGEKAGTVTVHYMTEQLDEGNIILKQKFRINNNCYISDLYAVMAETCPLLFWRAYLKVKKGFKGVKQAGLKKSLRCLPRYPYDSLIDWSISANEIARLVRASSLPFSGAYTYLNGRKVIIWKARPAGKGIDHLGAPGQVVSVNKKSGIVSVLTGAGVLDIGSAGLRRGQIVKPCGLVKSARARFGRDHGAIIEALVSENRKLACENRMLKSKTRRG